MLYHHLNYANLLQVDPWIHVSNGIMYLFYDLSADIHNTYNHSLSIETSEKQLYLSSSERNKLKFTAINGDEANNKI